MRNNRIQNRFNRQEQNGLYDPRFEHDNCGIGCVVNIKGVPSRAVVDNALKIVERLEHRAGKDAEGKTGDGAGVMVQISHTFFKKVCDEANIPIADQREYGVGMFFFPQDEKERNREKTLFETIVRKEGLSFLGWRTPAVYPEVLGLVAREHMPYIMQGFIAIPDGCEKGIEFDRRLYIVRRMFEKSSKNTYIPSLSSRTIVYKGMFLVHDLRLFYGDLQDEDYTSAIAVVHSRYSTNTLPSWEKAHPNRLTVHNGEINTIIGNQDKMRAREESVFSSILSDSMDKVLPIINTNGSDSARLDNALEFMVMAGMDLPLAIMITIPEPWINNVTMSREKKDFYQYYATMMEPWDGPASILFTDGDILGACLDRNGLRPSRYYITEDDMLILSSEVGVMDVEPDKVLIKERLRPGRILLVDTVKGKVISDDDLKHQYAGAKPYGEWLADHLVTLKNLKIPNEKPVSYPEPRLVQLQKVFGYSYEEIRTGILPMAKTGEEIVEAMGEDRALPLFSENDPPLFDYFKQLFAQVTNPPFDAIREEIVTATTVYLGKSGNILDDKPENCHVLAINNPILTTLDMMKIKSMNIPGFKVAVIPIVYYKTTTLEDAVKTMCSKTDKAIAAGANIIILSDRDTDELRIPIPSLLAVSALQQHLVARKKRTSMSLILESGEPREVHHFAALIGYGASAVHPYLAHESIRNLIDSGALQKDYYAAEKDYNKAIIKGVVKIASKMGISTIQSYLGSKIFEAVSISKSVIDEYFTGTVSRVEGVTLEDISQRSARLHQKAFDPMGLYVESDVPSVGNYKFRSGKEEHLYNPLTIHLLQESTSKGDYDLFKQFSQQIYNETSVHTLRSLMDIDFPADGGIPIDEVESVDEIVKRFKTGAMSYGSISQEAHETLAIAMNQLGGKSNSGEGGEDPERLTIGEDGLNRCSAIKQVASGRFGVTSQYLISAKEIQIKMAQGAKPGEGGQLPGGKVYPWIAKTRHSTSGVGLISPPPHHDIYSIEDLAQLIYDLKNANKNADITVKLVSEAGVGTIATGVAKAGASIILISGYDGGTGAAPRNSIHNAGLPWELGLAETHQMLIENNLRSRVRIETDGKLMTGRDVLIAALLGAEEYGFATAPLITMGCVMMRVCHLDTCPVGIATQNPELRKRFRGKPEYVMNFMRFVAQELREYMAKLGVRTVDELVGRTDFIKLREFPKEHKARKVDLSRILYNPHAKNRDVSIFRKENAYDFGLDKVKDETVIIPAFADVFDSGKPKTIDIEITNLDRTFGTIFGSEITKKFGNTLPDDTFTIRCKGSGGQSFGAFIPKGLTIEVEGDSNDYFGKGLSGGTLVIYPPAVSKFKADENIIIGNVAFYGATSGKAFIAGVAGERFCVRNSGVHAVVEGVSDHGCEYMTGGRVVILGRTGKNFAAGMSGGIAYVLDEDNAFYLNLNREMVSAKAVTEPEDIEELRCLIEEHTDRTGSIKGRTILDRFDAYLPKFKKVMPHDYARMQKSIKEKMGRGMEKHQAEIQAFYENAVK